MKDLLKSPSFWIQVGLSSGTISGSVSRATHVCGVSKRFQLLYWISFEYGTSGYICSQRMDGFISYSLQGVRDCWSSFLGNDVPTLKGLPFTFPVIVIAAGVWNMSGCWRISLTLWETLWDPQYLTATNTSNWLPSFPYHIYLLTGSIHTPCLWNSYLVSYGS